jgi:hypothetical protein
MSVDGQPRFGTTSDVILKSVVAVVTGIVAYLVTNLTDEPTVWVLTISAFIGGVVLIVQFLIDFEQRLKSVESSLTRHSDSMTALVERRFGEISQVVELFNLVEASATRMDVIQFLRHAVKIDDSSPLLYDFAHAEIRRMSQFLKELGDGSASYLGEDRDWLLALTRSARDSIDATSLQAVDAGGHTYDDGFWDTDLGNRYLEYQKDAVGRHVKIRRVFVLDDAATAADEAFRRTCRRHAELDIEVRVLKPEAIPPTLQSSLFDFILFDGIISYQVTPATRLPNIVTRPAIVNTTLVLRPDLLSQNKAHFEELWAAAEPFDPRLAPVAG